MVIGIAWLLGSNGPVGPWEHIGAIALAFGAVESVGRAKIKIWEDSVDSTK